jgi:hypothetical protein
MQVSQEACHALEYCIPILLNIAKLISYIHAWYINFIAIYINMCDYIFMDANCLVINLIVLGVIVLFVETPRKFITAVINVRGVSTNKTIICFIAMQTYKELVLGVST